MSWIQSAYGQSNGLSTNGGYVIAQEVKPSPENSEAVPEPATIAGLTLAAAGLGAAQEKVGSIQILKSKCAYLRPNNNCRDIVVTVAFVT